MNSVTSVVLAVVLVASLLAMPVIASSPTPDAATDDDPSLALQQVETQSSTPTEVEHTTNRLQLTGEIRNERIEYGSDLGVALASADDQLRVDYEQYTLIDAEFATASADEREDMIRAAYNDITDRTDRLEEREREAVRAHASGTISDSELIQTLVRNHNEAAALSDALDELTDRTDEVPGYALSRQQVRADRTTLELYQTSLRTTLERASQSSSVDRTVDLQVQTSQDGYRLSTIENEMYVVETVRFDNRDADAPNQFENLTTSEMVERATEYYPWADEHGMPSFRDSSAENLYVTTIDLDHSQLQMYLDGGTAEIHREIQELSLASLPAEDEETWTGDGLEVSLTETPANGPAAVTVIDSATDEPTSATITIGGVEVGDTGADGTLWFVPPVGEYELAVETGTDSTTVTVPNG